MFPPESSPAFLGTCQTHTRFPLDRAVEKTLEKVRKFKSKKNYHKARTLLEEIPLTSRGHLEVAHENVSVSLMLDPWQDLLKVLRHALVAYDFNDLLGGDNREAFVSTLSEHPAFASALIDMLGQMKSLGPIADWFHLSDPADQRFMIDNWTRLSDDAADSAKDALLKVSAGVGMMLTNDEPGAFKIWSRALSADPRHLKKIMNFCQSLSDDQREINNRLRLIRLVAAAGKRNESLTLLNALGNESDKNAIKVLNEMPEVLPGQMKDKEVLAVRFKLALQLGDSEIIEAIISDMDELSEDELFPFRKQVLYSLTDKNKRQTALLNFVRLYVRQENWENAAPLLQMLYEEHQSEEVVTLMEQVLERFPIISSLRFLLGKHMLDKGNVMSGMQHLSTIAQVPEYEKQIRRLLEDRLQMQYDSEVARLLITLQDVTSMEAGLIAVLMSLKDPRGLIAGLPEWGDPHLQEQNNPFWALALMRANLTLRRFEQAYAFLCQLLKRFPDLSPEAVYCAELLCTHFKRDYTDLIRIIDALAENMEPKRAWGALRKRFIAATKSAKGAPKQPTPPRKPAAQAPPPAPAPAPKPAPQAPRVETSGMPPEFHHFRGHVEAGNYRAAAQVAEKTVAAYPQSILYVLNQLERLSREHGREILWPLTMLRILIASAQFEKAAEVGRRVLANHHFHADMPQIYQLLARAYEGMDNQTEALRFYCLSSRQTRFYEQNRERLLEMVLPQQHAFVEEVAQLVINNEDQDIWEELLKQWYKARPEDLEKIIKAQEAFSDKLDNPRGQLDLAFWYLQAGRLHEIDEALDQIDLHDPEILDYLTHIANLAHLKYPEDPKPKFLLGKYYLVQQDVTKAVDTFRNLARQIPEAAETIYHYLRTYLKKNATNTDLVTLYGLLIRFALDHGSAVSAVRLLEELGRVEQDGAASLINGVFRVILRKDERLEAMYELMRLLYDWEDFERLLEVSEQGGFGDHMAGERLEWLHVASEAEGLHDRAMLSIAQVYFDIFDFSRCREALRRIEHGTYRRQALPLYEKLTERFPDQMDVWREAGWAAFPQNPEKARLFFTKLFECKHFENRLEAYALLRELGANPDFEDLTELVNDANLIYTRLFELHASLRDIELAYWESTEQSASENALQWLIANGRYSRFREDLEANVELGAVERAILEARALIAQGLVSQAAWHIVRHPVPPEMAQSLLCSAGMIEKAVLSKKPGTRLPIYLRDAFLTTRGKPASICATAWQIQNCQRSNHLNPPKKDEVPV